MVHFQLTVSGFRCLSLGSIKDLKAMRRKLFLAWREVSSRVLDTKGQSDEPHQFVGDRMFVCRLYTFYCSYGFHTCAGYLFIKIWFQMFTAKEVSDILFEFQLLDWICSLIFIIYSRKENWKSKKMTKENGRVMINIIELPWKRYFLTRMLLGINPFS